MVVISSHQPPPSYYRYVREDIIKHIVGEGYRVLDVGCGEGMLGEYLKQYGNASMVVGIEVDTKVAGVASSRLDHVLCADLNLVAVGELLASENFGKFDFIICADVLEHLVDPWQSVAQLIKHLAPNGKIIVSLPNVRHWSVWLPLVFRGRWEYRDRGIMDRTHLRFFTKLSAVSLLANAGLLVVECRPLIGGVSRLINVFTMSLFSGVLGRQWVMVGENISVN